MQQNMHTQVTLCVAPAWQLSAHSLLWNPTRKSMKNLSAQAALTCPKFFDTLEALKAHLDSNSVYSGILDDHKCQHCPKAFTGKTPLDNLKKHVKYRCTLNPNVSLEYTFCKFCGKRYHEQKYLKDHEKKCPVGQSKVGFRGRGKGKWKGHWRDFWVTAVVNVGRPRVFTGLQHV